MNCGSWANQMTSGALVVQNALRWSVFCSNDIKLASVALRDDLKYYTA